jgi:hypothetical protein
MIVRGLAASFALVCGLGACTATPEVNDKASAGASDEIVASGAEALLGSPTPLATACVGNIDCPPQFVCPSNPDFDADCGDPFCRTPGVQCGGQLSLFTLVEHFSICHDSAGNTCIAARQGRRLISCGC